jgi:S-adenosylmethionine hydrolase
MPPVITLLTDFGTRDAYVGAMKGVILGIAADATIVDIAHDLPPQDVHEAAWLLRTSFAYFPPGTVHVAVVDPGVGTERRAIAARAGGMMFVGPDNGVLSWALTAAGDARAVEISNRAYMRDHVSDTFHGRDVFAPAAAHLANGVPLDSLGPPVADPMMLSWPAPRMFDDRIECEVAHVDRFGNLITSLDRQTLDAWRRDAPVWIEIAGETIDSLARTYGAAPPGALVALFDSSDHLEIAVCDGSAASRLHAARGETVVVRRR